MCYFDRDGGVVTFQNGLRAEGYIEEFYKQWANRKPKMVVKLWLFPTFVSYRQRAVEVLLLQGPRGVVHFVGDPTRALTVHLDGWGEKTVKRNHSIVQISLQIYLESIGKSETMKYDKSNCLKRCCCLAVCFVMLCYVPFSFRSLWKPRDLACLSLYSIGHSMSVDKFDQCHW